MFKQKCFNVDMNHNKHVLISRLLVLKQRQYAILLLFSLAWIVFCYDKLN